MAEAVGVIASGITLAALFKTSVEVFKLIQAAEHHDRDLKKLITKLRLHGCRLFEWGKHISVVADAIDSEPEGLPIHPFRQTIKDALTEIITLFHDAKRLRERYGCRERYAEQQEATELSVLSSIIELPQHAEAESNRLMRAVGRTRWAIRDRKRFVLFIVEINDLVDALCKATESIAPQRSQTRGLTSRFSTINNAETLDLVSDACGKEYPALAKIAADRSEMLTLGTTARWRLERWELETKIDRDRMMLQTETHAVGDELERSNAIHSSLSLEAGADFRESTEYLDAVETGNFDRHLEEEAATHREQTKAELQRLKDENSKLVAKIAELQDRAITTNIPQIIENGEAQSEELPRPFSMDGLSLSAEGRAAENAATVLPERRSCGSRTSHLPRQRRIPTPFSTWLSHKPGDNVEADKLRSQVDRLQAELTNRRRASEPRSAISCENLTIALFAALAWSYGARWDSETMVVGESFCIRPPYQPNDVELLPGKKGNLGRAKHFVSRKRRQAAELTEWSRSQRLAGHVYLESIVPRYNITTAVLPNSNSCVGRDAIQKCHNCGERYSIWAFRNHFVCECGAAFCVDCGQKWKTCNCPEFCQDLVDRTIWRPTPVRLTAASEVRDPPWHRNSGPLWLQHRRVNDRPVDKSNVTPLTISDAAASSSTNASSPPEEALLAEVRSRSDEGAMNSHSIGDAAPAA